MVPGESCPQFRVRRDGSPIHRNEGRAVQSVRLSHRWSAARYTQSRGDTRRAAATGRSTPATRVALHDRCAEHGHQRQRQRQRHRSRRRSLPRPNGLRLQSGHARSSRPPHPARGELEAVDTDQTSLARCATVGYQDRLFDESGSRSAPPAYFDPREILHLAARRSRARRALHSIDVAIDEEVQRARKRGVSWNEIANHLGISRQGARQHYGEGSGRSQPEET